MHRHLFGIETPKRRFAEAWTLLAEHYVNHPTLGCTKSSPSRTFGCGAHGDCADWPAIPKFYTSVVPSIRTKDPRTPLIVGPGGSYDIKRIDTALLTGVEGVVYTGDILSHAATDPEAFGAATAFRDAARVPIFIQQIGVKKSDLMAADTTAKALDALNQAGVGWTWWTYREPRSPGNGCAPYYRTSTTDWQLDMQWLGLIDGYFK